MFPALALGNGEDDDMSDVETIAFSKSMESVLKRHDIPSKRFGSDESSSSPVVVREPKLFKMLTSVCLDKLTSVIPANVVCLASLALQVKFN